MRIRSSGVSSALVLGMCIPLTAWAQDNDDDTDGNGRNGTQEFSETAVIVEINATDGDIGFQAMMDAEGWTEANLYAPGGRELFEAEAEGGLKSQRLTETAFESEEPLCAPDPDEPDAQVVPLSDFLARFPEGTYTFIAERDEDNDDESDDTGNNNNNDDNGSNDDDEDIRFEGAAELTHALPAAPDIVGFDGTAVTWQPGTGLGRCQADDLVAAGALPDPGSVGIVGWEVVVEPADEEAVDPLRVFSTQLPAGDTNMVTVPAEFIDAYRAENITAFKVGVGAIEESGNRTFSEEVFSLEGEAAMDEVEGGQAADE